jgi:glucosamine 6-phosphate synthetase-like amidotransferase/phosphosugar isomerase protein
MDETRVLPKEHATITLTQGVIGSLITSIIVFVLSAIWMHQVDITLLKTNQVHVMATILKLDTVPADIAVMKVKLEALSEMMRQQAELLRLQSLAMKVKVN